MHISTESACFKRVSPLNCTTVCEIYNLYLANLISDPNYLIKSEV
jgi:hypothetical protein